MRVQKALLRRYLLIHAAMIAGLFLFPVYRLLTSYISNVFASCFLHDRLFLYCPACGGTRALEALLRFDLSEALRFNALLPVALFLVVALDLWALIRLLRGESELLPLPGWSYIVLSIVLLSYGILRNYLMIAHGIDPIGDLGSFWHP